MSEELHRRRLYDRSQELVQAVKMLTLMPDDVRSIVSEGILSMIAQEYEEAMDDRHYRSIGSFKVLGLHKTQNRLRAYDQNPILHKAISRLYILSEGTQDEIGRHIADLLGYIQRYFENCQELQQDASMEDVAEMTDKYVANGPEEAEAFLKKVREEFHMKLHGYPEPTTAASQQVLPEDIDSNQKGMKINKLEIN